MLQLILILCLLGEPVCFAVFGGVYPSETRCEEAATIERVNTRGALDVHHWCRPVEGAAARAPPAAPP